MPFPSSVYTEDSLCWKLIERSMEFKNRTLKEIADFICGNFKAEERVS